jgi:hypothetical protein
MSGAEVYFGTDGGISGERDLLFPSPESAVQTAGENAFLAYLK